MADEGPAAARAPWEHPKPRVWVHFTRACTLHCCDIASCMLIFRRNCMPLFLSYCSWCFFRTQLPVSPQAICTLWLTLCAVFFMHSVAADLCVLQAVNVGMFCKTVLPLEPLSMVCLHYILLSWSLYTRLFMGFFPSFNIFWCCDSGPEQRDTLAHLQECLSHKEDPH